MQSGYICYSYDDSLTKQVEAIDVEIRAKFGMTTNDTSVGVLDLKTMRAAGIRERKLEYAASVAKIGILLAYFQFNRQAATNLDPKTKHELGLMIKASSNEMATRFSEPLGLERIQLALNSYGLYDEREGGGLWMGKHYGKTGERIGDPVGDNSHAARVKELLIFYWNFDQGRLVSPQASKVMRDIFDSPEIPHDNIKFVKGLAGRDVKILRKWGSWENWQHDSAIIEGPNRKYILVALTHHPRGDEYLEELARRVDDLINAQ
jgi:beta-lactamase class A